VGVVILRERRGKESSNRLVNKKNAGVFIQLIRRRI
jgi:hypothetical protein